MYAIQADNIIKHYKNGVQALDGLTISVKTGGNLFFIRSKWCW